MTLPRHRPVGTIGAQLGNSPGASLEFKDRRDYYPGDDLRSIDWMAFARSDRLTVKVWHEEISPMVELVLDTSCSMDVGDPSKAAGALALAGVFVAAGNNAGFAHRVHTTGDRCQRIARDSQDPSNWDAIAFHAKRSPGEALLTSPPQWQSRSLRVFISDLLLPEDPLTLLQRLGHHSAAVFVVQVLNESDLHPPQRGTARLVDAETGERQDVFIDATAQRRYQSALARHEQAWRSACQQQGAIMTRVLADPLLDAWNLTDLIACQMLSPK